MRVISGAQLRITDPFRLRVTVFATNSTRGQRPATEPRHLHRDRGDYRLRCTRDSGLRNLPLHTRARNHTRCAIITSLPRSLPGFSCLP